MDAQAATSAIPTRRGDGFLRVVSNSEMVRRETEQKNKDAALAEQNKPQMLRLAQYVKSAWQAARNAKTSAAGDNVSVETRILRCARQRNGTYDPERKASITKWGGSDVYMMLTNVKCRAAKSCIMDIMIPPGEKPWSISPTPVPDLPDAEEVEIEQQVTMETAQIMVQGGMESVTSEQIAERIQEIRGRLEKERVTRAKEATSRFEARIEDDLVEGGYYGALGDFIDDLVTFPTAFFKGPIVRRKKKLAWTEDQAGQIVPAIEYKYVREYSRVSPLDMYPSPGAKNVQDGYLCERHRLRRSDLVAMIGVDGFHEPSIRAVLDDYGTGGLREWLTVDQERANVEGRPNEFDDPDPPIDAVEFWGFAQGKTLLEWGMSKDQVLDADLDYQVNAWLIGQYIIMARLNPHPLGSRPYYAASFESLNDSIWGKSPPELMRDVQNVCNAIARALVNNLGVASGPQVEVMMDRVQPGEDVESIWPWKIWKTKSDATGTGKYAIQFYQPNSMADTLIKVYEYFFEQASEQSGIPAYIYGNQDVGGAGDTASGLSMLMNAAAKTLKNVVNEIDKNVVKPSIYEHWMHLMLYDDDIMKVGDINIVARASEYLIIQEQLQIRRMEFMDRTNNDLDLSIMGEGGRATLLRETSKTLKLPEEIVPSKEDMTRREQMMQQGGPMMVPPGGIPPDMGGGMAIPEPAVINAAGGRPNEGATMGPPRAPMAPRPG